MDLNEVAVFIRVVQTGSFSRAAQQLGMPNSTVSSKVSTLEKRLGVTLIQRTTRKLHVTPIGQAYFKRCIEGLEQIQAAEAEIAVVQSEPQGLLRLTAPVELGSAVLPKIINMYTQKYSSVGVEVLLSDRRIDLLEEGVDLAIRAGELKDSSLIAKKIGSVYFAPFASPHYIKAHGVPANPKDLRDHQFIQFTPLGAQEWKLTSAKGSVTVPTPGRIVINDLNMVKMLAVAGSGVALIPTFFCYPEVKAGKLVRVLPEWHSQRNPVHFVYPAQKFVTPKLSAFIAIATDVIKDTLQDIES